MTTDPTAPVPPDANGPREAVKALADACEDDYQRSLRAAGLTCRDCAYVGYHCGGCGCCDFPAASEAAPTAGECPTCGPTSTEPHPRRSGVTRCGNCKEWLTEEPWMRDDPETRAALLRVYDDLTATPPADDASALSAQDPMLLGRNRDPRGGA